MMVMVMLKSARMLGVLVLDLEEALEGTCCG
jgi:hypothetical protein